MGSLGGCFKRLGISGPEATYIRELAKKYREEGFEVREANTQAVDELLATMETERSSIITQITTLKPELKPLFERPRIVDAGEIQEARQPIEPTREAVWTETQPTGLDKFIRLFQDKSIDLRRIIKAMEDAGLPIPDQLNPVFREEMYNKRAEQQTTDYRVNELEPLTKAMAAHGVTLEQMDRYLHARHVINDRVNEKLQRLNPDLAGTPDFDKLAGISDQEARGILSATDRLVMEPLAQQVDTMVRRTRQLMVEYGLESQERVDQWNEEYTSYVPLHREGFEEAGHPTGTGFSVRGSTVRDRLGSNLKVTNVLANIAQARDQVVTRGEKMRPVVALAGLLLKYPNLEFARLDKYAPITEVNPTTGLEELIPGDLSDYKRPMIRRKDPTTGHVSFYPDPTYKGRENVVNFRIGGKDYAIVFNSQNERAMEVAKGLKNLDTPQLNGLLRAVAPYTRYLAAVNTQFNPLFGLVNFIRDVQFAMLALQSTPLAGKGSAILSNVVTMAGGIWEDARAVRRGERATSDTAQLWQRFEHVGGPTGYRDLFFSSTERADNLREMLTPKGWSQIRGPKDFAKVMEKTSLFQALSDYNLMMENSIRLAVFKVGIDSGMSDLKAASYAKNITVNFNKRGQLGAQIGALYAFFNANVQGTGRLLETIAETNGEGWRFTPLGKQIITGGVLLGIAQTVALALAGFEDDEPPEYVKQKNLVIPAPGTEKGYLQIPMPLGFNLLPSVGRLAAETLYAGFSGRPPRAIERASHLLDAIVSTFNPLGGSDALQTAMPTVADPVAALKTNQDWTGKPIYQEDINKLRPTPGHTRAHDSATFWSIGLSHMINWATGGTDYVPGKLSPSPDAIDYLFGQATGGVGREITKIAQSARSLYTGEDLPINRLPGVGRFAGSSSGKMGMQDRFYDNIRQINAAAMEIEGRAKNQEDFSEFMKEHPEAGLKTAALQMQKYIGDLREDRHKLVKNGAPKSEVQRREQQISNLMQSFNDQVERMRQGK